MISGSIEKDQCHESGCWVAYQKNNPRTCSSGQV